MLLVSSVCMMPPTAAFMLRIQPARCTGLIHDLVEGAVKGGRAAESQLQYGYDRRSNVH